MKNFLKDYCWDNVGAGAGGACTGTGAGAGAAGTAGADGRAAPTATLTPGAGAGADGRAAPTATLTPGAGAGAGAAGAAVQPVGGHTGYYCVTCNTTITFEEANKNEKNCTCNEGYLPIGERTCKSVDDLGAGAGTAGTAGAAAGTAGAGADADAHALFACEQIGELIGAKSGVNEPTATLTPGAGAGAAGAAVQPVGGHTGYYCVTCNTTITFEEANKNEKNCTCNEGYLPIGERTCKSVDDLGAGAGTAGTAGAAAGTAGAGADADAHALFACEQIGELIGAKSGVNEAKCIEMEARFKFLLSLRPGSEVNDEVSVCLYIIYIYIILCIYILC